MIQNNRINMPSKKSQKRKKSTQNSNAMSNSLVNNSNTFSVGQGGNQVAQIHQTLQLKPNLKNIYASAAQSHQGTHQKRHGYNTGAQHQVNNAVNDSFSTGPTSQKVFRRSGTNTSNTSNPRGRKKVYPGAQSMQPKMMLLNNSAVGP